MISGRAFTSFNDIPYFCLAHGLRGERIIYLNYDPEIKKYQLIWEE